jgi:transposase InsO family protein
MDLASRRIVGWHVSSRLDQDLALQSLMMALRSRRVKKGQALHHSDRGVQYASEAYQRILAAHGIRSSMSRKGDCWDNAVAESFFATLKTELVADAKWESRSQARREVAEYIDWYNNKRRHQTLGYLPPARYEIEVLKQRRVA